jgi:hypothetical protein
LPGDQWCGLAVVAAGRILVAVLDEALLADWCGRYLGDRPACVLFFRSGHLSQVTAPLSSLTAAGSYQGAPVRPRIAGCIAV